MKRSWPGFFWLKPSRRDPICQAIGFSFLYKFFLFFGACRLEGVSPDLRSERIDMAQQHRVDILRVVVQVSMKPIGVVADRDNF